MRKGRPWSTISCWGTPPPPVSDLVPPRTREAPVTQDSGSNHTSGPQLQLLPAICTPCLSIVSLRLLSSLPHSCPHPTPYTHLFHFPFLLTLLIPASVLTGSCCAPAWGMEQSLSPIPSSSREPVPLLWDWARAVICSPGWSRDRA